jgi:hypothetical protein
MGLKAAVKSKAPWLVPLYSHVIWNYWIRPRWRKAGMAGVFTQHFEENGWGCSESISGHGSTVSATQTVRSVLPKLIAELGVQSVLDIPCGDFNWMQHVDLPVRYIGADIVDELIERNRRRFASDLHSFVQLDVTVSDLPKVDLVLCRDYLFHLSFYDITKAIDNLCRSGSSYLLATTNPNVERNRDIVTGE